MTRTTQTEATMRPLLLESGEDVGSVARKLRTGQALLKVVAYPWGVEFEVCETEGGR